MPWPAHFPLFISQSPSVVPGFLHPIILSSNPFNQVLPYHTYPNVAWHHPVSCPDTLFMVDTREGRTERTRESSQITVPQRVPHRNHHHLFSAAAAAAPALPALPSLSPRKKADPPGACWTKFIQCNKSKLNPQTSLFQCTSSYST